MSLYIFRHFLAALFSRCVLDDKNCCKDPVVYERIDGRKRNWIIETAPGVRDSRGCLSMIKKNPNPDGKWLEN